MVKKVTRSTKRMVKPSQSRSTTSDAKTAEVSIPSLRPSE